jgi:hypothetical protein
MLRNISKVFRNAFTRLRNISMVSRNAFKMLKNVFNAFKNASKMLRTISYHNISYAFLIQFTPFSLFQFSTYAADLVVVEPLKSTMPNVEFQADFQQTDFYQMQTYRHLKLQF